MEAEILVTFSERFIVTLSVEVVTVLPARVIKADKIIKTGRV